MAESSAELRALAELAAELAHSVATSDPSEETEGLCHRVDELAASLSMHPRRGKT